MKSLLAAGECGSPQAKVSKSRLTPGPWALLALAFVVATGCAGTASEPQPTPETSTTDPATESTDEGAAVPKPAKAPDATTALASETDTAAIARSTIEPGIVAQTPPGYVDYPYMGQTPAGEDIYYIYSEPLDCERFEDVTRCENSLRVEFVQVDAAGFAENGSLVADCLNEELTEVIVDGDLVAYRLPLSDVARLNLWTYACEAPAEAFSELKSDDIEPTNIESLVIQPFESGESYAEYRDYLLNLGLTPKAVTLESYTLLEQRMYDAGYTEVLGCSGEGLCRFEFEHSEPGYLEADQVIVVITYLEGQTPYTSSVSRDVSAASDSP